MSGVLGNRVGEVADETPRSSPAEVRERFGALLQLVASLHDRCKQDQNVESLIDTFCHFDGLAQAFNNDCNQYLAGQGNVPTDIAQMTEGIHEGLSCSAGHLRQWATKLGTNILEHLAHKIHGPPPSQEQLN